MPSETVPEDLRRFILTISNLIPVPDRVVFRDIDISTPRLRGPP